MINAIRADIYRLFRSKGFWITQAALVLLIVFSVITQTSGSVGITKNVQRAADATEKFHWDTPMTLLNLSTMSSLIIYFLLSLFIIVLGYDLKNRSLKNLFSSGSSRAHFFLSKYLIFNATVIVQFILYYGVTFITAVCLHGPGKYSSDFFSIFFGSTLLQVLFTQAIFAVGILVLYLTFSTVWSILAVIVFPLVINIVANLTNIDWISRFDFQQAMSGAQALPHKQIPEFIASACVVLILLVGGAYVYFQRKDL